jgi:hypothetical protein
LPAKYDWQKLEQNVRKGISYEKLIQDFPYLNGLSAFQELVPVAAYLLNGRFAAMNEGIYRGGFFEERKNKTIFFSDDSGPILLEIFSNGNPTLEKEVQYIDSFNKNSVTEGYSVRCIKNK